MSSESPAMEWKENCVRSTCFRFVGTVVTLCVIAMFIAAFHGPGLTLSAMSHVWNSASRLYYWNDSLQSREDRVSMVCINNQFVL